MFDPGIVDKILLGIGGLTVVGITEMLKRFFKVDGLWAYIISLVVSAGATAYVLLSSGTFNLLSFAGYSFFVWIYSNGLYKSYNRKT
jgi:hypothetical protein